MADGVFGQTLMRAPSEASLIVMLVTKMSSTMSKVPAYWPRLPTEMPWLPVHESDWTRMLVLLGLNETQSSFCVVIPEESASRVMCLWTDMPHQ